MKPLPIAPRLTEGGLDQRTLNELKRRFRQVNGERLERLESALQPKQAPFLDYLPFLFHVNHYMLPGWVEDDTPSGVSHYRPDKHTLGLARKLSRSFSYKSLGAKQPDITSIFLMGSTGTIAQSSTSDLDIWLCHRSDLNQDQVYLLEQKAEAISKWAESLNLEVHFFVMNAHKFKGGEKGVMSHEHSGSTQHFLLLDEFYRTGLLVAGAYPIWWLVPADEEKQYNHHVAHIAEKGFLNYQETVDFGGVSGLPAGEFVSAAMWQLYKAIDSPYKSVLKLLLMEVYADDFPNNRILSLDYKQSVYEGETALAALDPYIMMYRRIERYLEERMEYRRLELARRCFYFKVNIALSRPTRSGRPSWRRALMTRLVKAWQWSDKQLSHLDNRNHWSVEQVLRERTELVNELTHSYRLLNQLSQKFATSFLVRKEDINVLGRKLSAAFDRKPGKIDIVNPNIATDLSHERLSLHQLPAQGAAKPVWQAYCNADLSRMDLKQPIKHTTGLVEMLAWSYFNGLLDAHVNIPVFSDTSQNSFIVAEEDNQCLSDFEIIQIISALRSHFDVPLPKVQEAHFHLAARPVKTVVFVNVGLDPLPFLRDRGLQKISERSDSLDFSALRENLVLSLDLVTLNSWNEVSASRFEAGPETLIQALQYYFNQLAKNPSPPLPELNVLCYSSTRQGAIRKRV